MKEVPNPPLNFREYPFNRELLTLLLSNNAVETQIKNTTLYNILNDSLVKVLSSYLKQLRSSDMEKFSKLINILIGERRDFFPTNLSEYKQIFNKLEIFNPIFPTEILNPVKMYVFSTKEKVTADGEKRQISLVPGEIGTGIYSEREYDVFDQLCISKVSRQITCTTYSQLPHGANRLGLQAAYTYSLLDVYKKSNEKNELLLLKLSDGNMQYELEINDYLNFFIGYTVTDNPALIVEDAQEHNKKIDNNNPSKQKIIPTFLSKIKSTTSKFASLFNRKKFMNENLFKNFSSIPEAKQEKFIRQLLKEDKEVQKKVFSCQTAADLQLIFKKCQSMQQEIQKKIEARLAQ